MSSIDLIKNEIQSNRKRQKVHQFKQKMLLKVQRLAVPLKCVLTTGEIQVHVRNEKCTKINCVFDLDEIAYFIVTEINKNNKFCMVKCPECSAYLDQSGFYVDQDMEDAIKKFREFNLEAYKETLFGNSEKYEVQVDSKNEWILFDKSTGQTIVLKESDMLTEYEKNYPFFPSKQTPDFYENGYVFVNENIDVLKNQKLQSVIYLFFPSLQNNRWKEVIVFNSVKDRRQAYFQKYMSVCKMYNKELGYHSIIASGGFGYPENKRYERKAFEVKLFSNDPDIQVPKETDLIDLEPMITPRVFHQLVCYNGKVYALGGYFRDHQKDVDVSLKSCERYNPISKKWEQISDLDHPRQLFTVVIYSNKLFVIGGKVSSQNSNQEEEDLSIEFFDTQTDKWSITYIFQYQNPQKYFTERAYSFVKSNDTVVIFGGRKEKTYNEQKPCERSRQAAELNLSTGEYQLSKDYLPPLSITFEGVTDFQGIYYNNRFIFGFKRIGKEDRKEMLIPSICKYYDDVTADKFCFEQFKKILY